MLKSSKIVGTTFFIFTLAIIFSVLGKFQVSSIPKLFDYSFFNLLTLVILVQAVTQTFKVNQYDKKVLKLVSSISGDIRYSMVVPPIIFGLLPMPAGAMLTAELTRTAGESLGARKKWIFFFNYWFRHVCEFSWPLYGALILAAGIAGIPLKNFILATLLYFTIAVIIGLVLIFVKVKPNGNKERIKIQPKEILLNLLSALTPVILIIVMIFLKIDLKYSLLIVLALLFLLEKTRLSDILKTLKLSVFSDITLIVLVVLLFKGIVENTDTLNAFARFLTSHKVPQIIPVIILPMIMAFLTGITSAGIGSTAPILQGLFALNPAFPYLAYISAITGVLISPFHLCFITTKEYFKVSFKEVYATITVPILLIQLVAILKALL
jgi:hypothetical protein